MRWMNSAQIHVIQIDKRNYIFIKWVIQVDINLIQTYLYST